MHPMHNATMEERFPKELRSLEAVFGFLERFIIAHSIEPDAAYVMTLAVEEFFTNIIKYGGTTRGSVTIIASLDGRQLTVELVDSDADRFDPTTRNAPASDLSLQERPIGGLGIHLSREMLDDVRYEYAGRTGKITLVKNLEQ